MMIRTLVTSCVLAALGAGAHADPKADAKAHVDMAATLHGQGKFADALAELETAYSIDAQPGLLYAMAQVQVKLDRCADAIPNYEKFIASKPGAVPEKAAHEAIEQCQKLLASRPPPVQPEPTPTPTPAPVPTPVPVASTAPDASPMIDRSPPPPPAEHPPTGRAWYKDPLGGVLVGAGVAGVAVGVVFYRKATADVDAAEHAANYGASEELVDRASSRRTIATIAGVAGAALITGGVLRYVIGGRGERRTVAVVPTSGGGAMVGLGGRF